VEKKYKGKSSYFQALFPYDKEVDKSKENNAVCDEISAWIVNEDAEDTGDCGSKEKHEDAHVDDGECLVTAAEGVDLVVEDVVRGESSENEIVERRHL